MSVTNPKQHEVVEMMNNNAESMHQTSTIIVDTANREAPFFSDPTDVDFPKALARKRRSSNDWNNSTYNVKSLLVDMSLGLKRIPTYKFYKYNFWPFGYCITYAIIVFVAGFYSQTEWLLILFIIPAIAIIWVIYIEKMQWLSKAKKQKKEKKEAEKYQDYDNYVNYVFNIRDDKHSVIPIDLIHQFALYVIFGAIIVGIQMILVQVLFSSSWIDRCDEIVSATEDDKEQGACLARHCAFTCTYTYFGYSFGVVLALFREPRKKYMKIQQDLKTKLQTKYEQGRIKFDTIDKRINKTIEGFIGNNTQCKDSSWFSRIRKYGYMVIAFGIVLSPIYVSRDTYISKMDLLGINYKAIGALIMFILDIPFSSFMLYQIWHVTWQGHSIFLSDYIPMDSLSGAIYITCIDDIKCWWDIRRFYRYYQQPLFSGGRGSLTFGSILLFTTLCLGFALYKIVIKDQNFNYVTVSADGVITMFVILTFVIIMIRYLITAVKTTVAQKNHVKTLEYELIRMKLLLHVLNDETNEFDDEKNDPDAKLYDDTKEMNESKNSLAQASKATQLFIQFLTKYDETPTILGIPMNITFLLTGLLYVVSCFLTIGSSVFF